MSLPRLLLQISNTRRKEKLSGPGSLSSSSGDHHPEQYHSTSEDGSEDPEHQTRQLLANLYSADSEDPQWKRETPPAHIEREWSCFVYAPKREQ